MLCSYFENGFKEKHNHKEVVDILGDNPHKWNLTIPDNAKTKCISNNASHYELVKKFMVDKIDELISEI